MKVCVVLLKVVLVVVVVEATAAASTGSAERVCPEEAIDYINLSFSDKPSVRIKVPLQKRVENLVEACIHELKLPRRIVNDTASTEDFQRLFDGICQKRLGFQECLSETATNLEVCPDPTIVKVFNIMREFLVRKFESGCDRNAERFVRLFSGSRPIKPEADKIGQCILTFGTIMDGLEQNEVDIPSSMFIIHNQIIAFKKCFSTIEMGASMREPIDYFIDETITTMQCIHPQDSTLVTCATLDPALVNFTNICDTLTLHNTKRLYDVLEGEAFTVFEDIMQQDSITDNEKLRESFKDFCDKVPRTRGNVQKVIEFARVCSNETEKIEVNLLVDNVKTGLEYACIDEGKRLTDIMFEVYRLKRTSPDHSHAVMKCIEVAKLTRKDSDEHRSSSQNMRLYHELETFKECFINKVSGDPTSVDAATSLINGILGIMECVKPEDGSTVLCASLMHDH